ncbi:S-adenosyl-L-methionine-dependentmethyltransferases superfamily protein [Striga asiatica]|uniref:S-adenosyl-L-methionine-dependentmethyltransferases superfamily protein n=1 Tax=Striga asiatica TaxID=4170 RepID=A0A5A7RKN0_STRAF|nr:S-adenosyl-L-methionine-dependentmethyltransferases superfamily protein [Striga asiatica]
MSLSHMSIKKMAKSSSSSSSYLSNFSLWRIMSCLQIMFGCLVILVSISTLSRFYSPNDQICRHLIISSGGPTFDLPSLTARINEVLDKLESLQNRLESHVQQTDKKTPPHRHMSTLEHKKFLENEVIRPLYAAHIALRQIRLPKTSLGEKNETLVEDPLINAFAVEEIRKYITPKSNRAAGQPVNIYGVDKIYNTIGHACVLMKTELEEYMDYDVGSYCNDDWALAQSLMIRGCDPLPRRRCLARASKLYLRPYPINESMWRVPDGRNVRWSNYKCRNFECLSSKNPKRGFSKCVGCFEMEKEKLKWVEVKVKDKVNTLFPFDFSINDVLAAKPGEIRIGLDFGVGTGTFAARMREKNVTIISTALNLGAPFSETIALRGLVPLYVTLNQRLPFFDNTMDIIHTTGFLDGWIDLQLLDFILFDWDRVLRPGGLLWIDRFFCKRKDLDDYMYMFLQFRYRKHKWAIGPKSKDEVYLSALLEKPPRSL